MIVEMLLQITEEQTLVAAWEFTESIWNVKEKQIRAFISNIFDTQNIQFVEKKWKDNIIFEIKGKPFQFYDIQNGFNDYFKSLGADILVD
jgi:hypothetical protein